jgi:LacI family gluconate utilization system Gnt-I transcriptional repressor
MRRVTLSDVAKLADVSPITVSRALRQPRAVSPELRERILAVVSQLGYVPDLAASRLASARTHLIGVIVPTLYNTIFADYLLAIHESLIDAGFQIVVVNSRYSQNEEEAAIKTLIGQRVEAIVVAGVRHTAQARNLLSQARVPVIETFDLADDPIGINIGLSQQEAGSVATRHLIDLGRRRVAFFAGNLDERASARLAGYRRAMIEAGLEAETDIVQTAQMSSIPLGSALMRDQFDRRTLPEAIFCVDDNIALGAMQVARDHGVRIPDDLAVIGFHDLDFAQCLTPSLTSIATRRYETGRLVAAKLIDILLNGNTFDIEKIDVGFELMLRQSTAAVPR